MTSVENIQGFNNLLYSVKRRGLSQALEYEAGHQPLDLSFKGYGNINNVLTAKASQINGKQGNIIYKPKALRSRPQLNYEEGKDPTILNSVRNKLVNVSGQLIPNRDLGSTTGMNTTQRPLIPMDIVF